MQTLLGRFEPAARKNLNLVAPSRRDGPTDAPLINTGPGDAERPSEGGIGTEVFGDGGNVHGGKCYHSRQHVSTTGASCPAIIVGMVDYVKRIKLLSALKEAKPQSLSERVKLLRRELSLTQDDIARMAGINRKTVGHLETGRNKTIPVKAAVSLCEKLGIAVKWLYGDTLDPSAFINYPEREQDILELFRRLRPADQDAVKVILESMVSKAGTTPTDYDPFPSAPRLKHEANDD